MNMLWDNRAVNNLTVAVISGFAVFNFVNTVGSMLFGDLFGSRAQWFWSAFWTELIVFVILLWVAMWINTRAKG